MIDCLYSEQESIERGTAVSNTIRVALLGLGRVGEVFAEHFLAQIQEHRAPVEIVAVADHHPDSPVALGFAQSGVPVYADPLDVVELGEKIDIIFDLTGDVQMRKALRKRLQATNNAHTIVASEMIANLLWCFFNDAPELPGQTQPRRGY